MVISRVFVWKQLYFFKCVRLSEIIEKNFFFYNFGLMRFILVIEDGSSILAHHFFSVLIATFY